jgi:hypothetical protein
MGIYIKDEKMPDTCTECFKRKKCDRYHVEILKTKNGGYTLQYITHNCPLIEVKAPHGRLVDEDVIRNKTHSIVYAPTVIEAEGE